MADSKTNKTTTAKGTAQSAAETNIPAAAKTEKSPAAVKETAVKTAVKTAEEPKKPAAKTPGRKPTRGRGAAKKTTAAKRGTTKKSTTEVKPDVFVQYGGKEFSESAIMIKVVAEWEAEGKKATAIKRVKLYVKPEDGKAYYVINEGLKNGSTGAVLL